MGSNRFPIMQSTVLIFSHWISVSFTCTNCKFDKNFSFFSLRLCSLQKHCGTCIFIGYLIKEYIAKYLKRVPNYDTGRMIMEQGLQTVQRYELKEDYYVYETAIINLTEKQTSFPLTM